MKVRSSNDVSCYPYPAPSEVDSNHGNPCSLVGNSLFPNVGNSPARTSSGAGSETLASPEAGIWTTSLHFPCRSGISVQRRVRYRLPPPPFSLPLRRFPAQLRLMAFWSAAVAVATPSNMAPRCIRRTPLPGYPLFVSRELLCGRSRVREQLHRRSQRTSRHESRPEC